MATYTETAVDHLKVAVFSLLVSAVVASIIVFGLFY